MNLAKLFQFLFARAAPGCPDVDHCDSTLREQILALYRIAINILRFKSDRFPDQFSSLDLRSDIFRVFQCFDQRCLKRCEFVLECRLNRLSETVFAFAVGNRVISGIFVSAGFDEAVFGYFSHLQLFGNLFRTKCAVSADDYQKTAHGFRCFQLVFLSQLPVLRFLDHCLHIFRGNCHIVVHHKIDSVSHVSDCHR